MPPKQTKEHLKTVRNFVAALLVLKHELKRSDGKPASFETLAHILNVPASSLKEWIFGIVGPYGEHEEPNLPGS